jgi:hypothetical protein
VIKINTSLFKYLKNLYLMTSSKSGEKRTQLEGPSETSLPTYKNKWLHNAEYHDMSFEEKKNQQL